MVMCTACGHQKSQVVMEGNLKSKGLSEIKLRRCAECGTIFLASWNEDYNLSLYDYYAERIGMPKDALYDQITNARYAALLAGFESIVPGNTVLDIGCGQGQFVDAALTHGWRALGIEVSEPAVRVAQGFDLPVIQADLFSNREEIKPCSFALCTLFEVIEHVPNPTDVLQRVEDLLMPGGYCYLTTPNFASLDRRVLGDDWEAITHEHLTYFTPATMKKLVIQNTGFEIIFMRTQNLSLGEIARVLLPVASRNCSSVSSTHTQSQNFRNRVESTWWLRQAKVFVNKMLNATNLGASMVVLLKKRL